jgi:hypothetical protein
VKNSKADLEEDMSEGGTGSGVRASRSDSGSMLFRENVDRNRETQTGHQTVMTEFCSNLVGGKWSFQLTVLNKFDISIEK